MTDKMTVGQLYPGAISPQSPRRVQQGGTPGSASTPFQDILRGKMELRFSHHAEMRLKQRGIQFKPEQLAKIEAAIDKAADKGSKDSLLLLGDTALIVNVKNRTVVTAVDGNSMKDNVFTQIDSAVVVS